MCVSRAGGRGVGGGVGDGERKGSVGEKETHRRFDFQIFPERLPRLARTGIIWLVRLYPPPPPPPNPLHSHTGLNFGLKPLCSSSLAPFQNRRERLYGDRHASSGPLSLFSERKQVFFSPLGKLDVICHFLLVPRRVFISDLPRHGVIRGPENLSSENRNW